MWHNTTGVYEVRAKYDIIAYFPWHYVMLSSSAKFHPSPCSCCTSPWCVIEIWGGQRRRPKYKKHLSVNMVKISGREHWYTPRIIIYIYIYIYIFTYFFIWDRDQSPTNYEYFQWGGGGNETKKIPTTVFNSIIPCEITLRTVFYYGICMCILISYICQITIGRAGSRHDLSPYCGV